MNRVFGRMDSRPRAVVTWYEGSTMRLGCAVFASIEEAEAFRRDLPLGWSHAMHRDPEWYPATPESSRN